MVKVFPVPVAPRRTWCFSPRRRPSTSSWIALGWSPRGSNSLTRRKGVDIAITIGGRTVPGPPDIPGPGARPGGRAPGVKPRSEADAEADDRRLVDLGLVEEEADRLALEPVFDQVRKIGALRIGVAAARELHPGGDPTLAQLADDAQRGAVREGEAAAHLHRRVGHVHREEAARRG